MRPYLPERKNELVQFVLVQHFWGNDELENYIQLGKSPIRHSLLGTDQVWIAKVIGCRAFHVT